MDHLGEDEIVRPSARRLLLLPAVLLGLLAVLPWVFEFVEDHWLAQSSFSHFREMVDTIVTALLGLWILSMLRREHETTLQHLAALKQLSLTDPLTGLGNRRAFERDLEIALRRAERTHSPLALLYLDVDGLKRLNDRFGHVVGDETLRALGAVMRSSSRLGTDTAYRVGGDEFVMVLTADSSGADAIAERLRANFRTRSPQSSRVSTGVVVWDGEARVQDLLGQADVRMYREKRPGAAPA